MLLINQRYRIITDRIAIAAGVLLLLSQWLTPVEHTAMPANAGLQMASSEVTTSPGENESHGLRFSELMLDLGLLLFLHR